MKQISRRARHWILGVAAAALGVGVAGTDAEGANARGGKAKRGAQESKRRGGLIRAKSSTPLRGEAEQLRAPPEAMAAARANPVAQAVMKVFTDSPASRSLVNTWSQKLPARQRQSGWQPRVPNVKVLSDRDGATILTVSRVGHTYRGTEAVRTVTAQIDIPKTLTIRTSTGEGRETVIERPVGIDRLRIVVTRDGTPRYQHQVGARQGSGIRYARPRAITEAAARALVGEAAITLVPASKTARAIEHLRSDAFSAPERTALSVALGTSD